MGDNRIMNSHVGPKVLIALILGLFVFSLTLDRSELVYPVPAIMFVIGAAAGAGLGLIIARWVYLRRKDINWRHVLGMVMIPVFGIAVGSYIARLTFEAYSFAGVRPSREVQIWAVSGISSGRHCCSAIVSADKMGRRIFVEIDRVLLDRLDPYRHPGRDCLKMQVEQGRHGVMRTTVPLKFFDNPLGIDSYLECPKPLAFPPKPA